MASISFVNSNSTQSTVLPVQKPPELYGLFKRMIGQLSAEKMFLGKSLNVTDETGKTFLHYAVEEGDEKLVEQMIDLGANPNISAPNEGTPLHLASDKRNLNLMALLIKKGAFIDQTHRRETPLHIACRQNNRDAALLLISSQAAVNLPDHKGETPLHIACQYGEEELVRALVKKGADLRLQNNEGSCPLGIATYYNHDKITEILVEAGAPVNLQNQRRIAPIHCAVKDPKKLNLIIQHGGDVNLPDQHGMTPLMYAANWGVVESVQLLLDHRANPLQQDRRGQTAAYWGNSNGKISDLLQKAGETFASPSQLPLNESDTTADTSALSSE